MISCVSFFLPIQLIIAVAGVLTGYNGSFEFQEPGQEYGEYPYVGMRVVSHRIVYLYWHLNYTFILLSAQCTVAKKGDVFVPFSPVETEHNSGNGTGGGRRNEMCCRLPIVASTKITPQESKKAKKKHHSYLSDRIWR